MASAGAVGDDLADSPSRIGGSGTRLVASATVNAFSDPAALLRLDDDDWGSHARSRGALNHAAMIATAAVGVESAGWRVLALTRTGGVATATPDAVTLLGLLSRNEAPVSSKSFALDYRLDYWRADGLSLARSWQFRPADGQTVEVGAAVQYLTRIKLLHQVFSGTASPAGADRMLFDGQNLKAGNLLRTDDPSKFNPFVRDGHPGGHGQALDVGARWAPSDHWQLEVAGFDIAARLKGKDMPESQRLGKFLYDGQGRLIGNADGSAAVQGLDRRIDLTVRPRTRWIARVGWQGGSWGFDVLGESQAGVHQLEVAARRTLGNEGYWIGASATARNPSLGLSVGNQWLSVGLATSRPKLGDARSLGASARISVPI